jgi:hypothetical protein
MALVSALAKRHMAGHWKVHGPPRAPRAMSADPGVRRPGPRTPIRHLDSRAAVSRFGGTGNGSRQNLRTIRPLRGPEANSSYAARASARSNSRAIPRCSFPPAAMATRVSSAGASATPWIPVTEISRCRHEPAAVAESIERGRRQRRGVDQHVRSIRQPPDGSTDVALLTSHDIGGAECEHGVPVMLRHRDDGPDPTGAGELEGKAPDRAGRSGDHECFVGLRVGLVDRPAGGQSVRGPSS